MPSLLSKIRSHTSSKPQPSSHTTTSSQKTTTNPDPAGSIQPLQPSTKNRTVGPEVNKMKEWDWAEGRRKDSGTGAAFLEDVRMGAQSPKTSVAAGAMGKAGTMPLQGLEGALRDRGL